MGLFDLYRESRKTTTISPSDVVVFIVGPTGSGKSWFMSILLQSANVHVRVSKGQKLGTTEVHAERCRFDGMQNDIMHNLAFDPDDEKLRVSNHLNAFGRACRQNLIPSTIHVVPTLSPEERLSDERLKILAIQLQRQADAEGAQLVDACDGKPFNGNPEMALNIIQGLFSACGADSRPRLIRCETRESPVDDRHACESTKAVSILPKLQANDESAKPCSTSHDGQPFSGKFQTAWDIMLKFLARFKIGTHGHPWLIPRETNHLKKPKG